MTSCIKVEINYTAIIQFKIRSTDRTEVIDELLVTTNSVQKLKKLYSISSLIINLNARINYINMREFVAFRISHNYVDKLPTPGCRRPASMCKNSISPFGARVTGPDTVTSMLRDALQ